MFQSDVSETTSLTPGFKHGFPNLQEQHFACWCEDFLGQRLWTYLSTDTWVAMRSQECNGTLVSNEVVDFVILLCWILTCCFGDIWYFLTKKSEAPCEVYQRYPFNTLSVWIWNLLSQIQLYSAICKQIQVFTENRRNPKLATPQPYLSCGAAAIKVILGSKPT